MLVWVASGKRLHSYGKPAFFIAKSTNSMAIFDRYVEVPEGNEKETHEFSQWKI